MTEGNAVNAVNGIVGTRQTTALGYTDPYGAQCVALVAWYFALLGYTTPIMPGYNAIDVYNKNPLGLEKIAPQDLQAGDVLFINYVSDGVNYGHTSIVIYVSNGVVTSVDQNWFNSSLSEGSSAEIVHHPVSSIVGGLRPQFKQEITMVDEPTLRWIFEQASHTEPPQDYLDQRVGKFTPFQCINEAINAPSAVAARANDAAAEAAKDQQITDLKNQLAAAQSEANSIPTPVATPPPVTLPAAPVKTTINVKSAEPSSTSPTGISKFFSSIVTVISNLLKGQ